jgi:hypothetical protein
VGELGTPGGREDQTRADQHEADQVNVAQALYRTCFPGRAGALHAAPEVGFAACGAGVERPEVAILFDQPLGIAAGDDVADGIADLVDCLLELRAERLEIHHARSRFGGSRAADSQRRRSSASKKPG